MPLHNMYFRLLSMPFLWGFHPLVKNLAEKGIENDGVVVFWLSQLLQYLVSFESFEFSLRIL